MCRQIERVNLGQYFPAMGNSRAATNDYFLPLFLENLRLCYDYYNKMYSFLFLT